MVNPLIVAYIAYFLMMGLGAWQMLQSYDPQQQKRVFAMMAVATIIIMLASVAIMNYKLDCLEAGYYWIDGRCWR